MKMTGWISLLAVCVLAWGCHRADAPRDPAVELVWMTDFEAAKARAAELKRPILANFSGSDWCGWCIKLDKEVFQQATFKQYAEKNLVLFLADFPDSKPQTEGLKMQNEILMARYGVQGFPTILLLDAHGGLLAQTGYQRGGPDAYVAHLRELLAASAP